MTQEEKARRYDEALERAKDFYKGYKQRDNQLYADDLETIFPELRESEDERIRKAIIDFFNEPGRKEYILNGFTVDDITAWLEKQGQKPILDFKAKDWYVSKVDGKIRNIYHSVDKNEPKFKVGDFIVNDYCFGKVIEITNDAYLLDTGQGIPFSCEHNAHLWTINDAKDGDVLVASDSSVFIYAGSTDRYAKFYAALTECGTLNLEGGIWEDKNSVHPATKEQRDILFAKMKEEGYEWSEKTHKLKKIEQNPAWSEEVDLEKEIELIKGDYEQVDVAWNNDFDFIARHFYELGLNVNK